LNSFNQERFDSVQQLRERMVADLSTAVAAAVEVSIGEVDNASTFSYLPGKCLDQLDVSVLSYQPDAALLQITGTKVVEETLFSHLLRSLCPVTAQPDWASVVIEYRGLPINHEGLLKYLIGYRQHQEFHEQCVERIYTDLMACCKPESLSVYARYVRRGGLDINPYRSSHSFRPVNWRLPRQ
jgi:7-cyano-7-deazaguanine reductase